jgi:hypothetical protein
MDSTGPSHAASWGRGRKEIVGMPWKPARPRELAGSHGIVCWPASSDTRRNSQRRTRIFIHSPNRPRSRPANNLQLVLVAARIRNGSPSFSSFIFVAEIIVERSSD